MIKVGTGFNCGYLINGPNAGIKIPEYVTHIELGLAEYPRWLSSKSQRDLEVSLHLARTPITEIRASQDIYIDHIEKGISKRDAHLSSVGIHLTGQRQEGIGKYGFSSHFIPTLKSINRANTFIEKMREKLGLSIWIENANFYSASKIEVFKSWEAINKICQKTGAGLIVDLSHLAVETRNSGLNTETFLNLVSWDHIVEIHLSGIIESRDGTLHDGHSFPVHNMVWELLDKCMHEFIPKDKSIVITIEHTDPRWISQRDEFYNDFEKLHNIIKENKLNKKSFIDLPSKTDEYARNYLKKLLRQWLPATINQLDSYGISFDRTFDDWIIYNVERDCRIVFTEEEIPLSERSNVCVATYDFSEFCERILTS